LAASTMLMGGATSIPAFASGCDRVLPPARTTLTAQHLRTPECWQVLTGGPYRLQS
jgi:hypothetical protein